MKQIIIFKPNYILLVLAISLVSACSSFYKPISQVGKDDNDIFTQPMREAKALSDEFGNRSEDQGKATETTGTEGIKVMSVPILSISEAAETAEIQIIPDLSETLVTRLAFNNMPVAAFINEVFGNQLSLDYVLEPGFNSITDLVTMRLNSSVSQKDLYSLATRTLRPYGVTTSLADDVLSFSYSSGAAGYEIPLIVTGRALPDVPPTNRPIFYIYSLSAVRTPSVRSLVSAMFPQKDLTIKEDMLRNALIFQGSQSVVNQAVQVTKFLDVPYMQGNLARVFRPKLSNVTDLAFNLEQVLKAQGYAVTRGTDPAAIRLLALESVNQLIVFTSSANVLDHVVAWAKTVEEEEYGQVEQGLFSYQVQ